MIGRSNRHCRGLVPLGLMHVQEMLEQEVELLAETWYARKSDEAAGRRFGSNPGTVRLAGQRVAIQLPRVRGQRGEIPLRSYGALKGPEDSPITLTREYNLCVPNRVHSVYSITC